MGQLEAQFEQGIWAEFTQEFSRDLEAARLIERDDFFPRRLGLEDDARHGPTLRREHELLDKRSTDPCPAVCIANGHPDDLGAVVSDRYKGARAWELVTETDDDCPAMGVGGAEVLEVRIQRVVEFAPMFLQTFKDEALDAVLIPESKVSNHPARLSQPPLLATRRSCDRVVLSVTSPSEATSRSRAKPAR